MSSTNPVPHIDLDPLLTRFEIKKRRTTQQQLEPMQMFVDLKWLYYHWHGPTHRPASSFRPVAVSVENRDWSIRLEENRYFLERWTGHWLSFLNVVGDCICDKIIIVCQFLTTIRANNLKFLKQLFLAGTYFYVDIYIYMFLRAS